MLSATNKRHFTLSHILKQNHLFIIIISFLIIVTQFVTAKAYRLQTNACTLITQADVGMILGVRVSEGLSRTTTMPAGQSCRYSYPKNGAVYGVTVKVSTDDDIKDEGINDSAADLMSRQKKARAHHAYASTTLNEVNNIADDAFWNGTDLWVLTGKNLLIVKSNSYLAEAFESKDEAKKAAEAQDLQFSLNIAKVVISRL